MSRENRRSGDTRSGNPRPRPARPSVAAAPEAQARRGTISWTHCLLGLLAGEAALLVLSNVALGVTNAVFGSAGLHNADGGIVGVSTLIAVICGGYVAGRLAGRWELYQGIAVAIGFIVIGAVFQFLQEAAIVHSSLASGTHYLVDLGPMNLGGVFSGDLLALFGGSVGGLLGARRTDPSSTP
jgi:hypothetical protein